MCKKRNSRFIVVMTAFMSLATRSGLAGVTNGDFAYGLDHWTIEAGTIEHSIDDEAIFAPDPDEALSSTLSQVFTLDTGALTLCFDVRMETESEDGTPETDVFTASLSGTTFYTLSSSDVSGGSFEQTVSYDVSNWAGEEVELRFSLEHDYADHIDTYAFLDNVGVPIVPGPGALVLAGLGVGLASWLRRCRVL